MTAVALRPRTIVELLDLTVTVYRAAWRPIVTASALLLLPLLALDALVAVVGFEKLGLSPLGLYGLRTFLGILHSMLCQGIVALLVADLVAGRAPDLAPALRATFRRSGTLFLASLEYYFIVGVGMLFLVVPGMLFAAMLGLYPAAIVLEHAGVRQSLSRSSALTMDHVRRCLAALVVLFVFQVAVGSCIGAVVGWGVRTGALPAPSLVITTDALSLVSWPLTSIVAALLYFDLRVRKEGLDLDVDLAALAPGQPAPATAPAGGLADALTTPATAPTAGTTG